MDKIINNSYVNLIFRLVLGSIFLIAASSKLADPSGFAKEIANYRILPELILNILAITLPWVELVCSIFIISGIRLKSVSFIMGILIIVFNVAVLIAMIKGLNINCGCHTKLMAEQVGWKKIFENLGLFVLACTIFISKSYKFTLEYYILKKSALSRLPAFRNLN
jgi:putative oxidoreductase